jgi:hypothetical protein
LAVGSWARAADKSAARASRRYCDWAKAAVAALVVWAKPGEQLRKVSGCSIDQDFAAAQLSSAALSALVEADTVQERRERDSSF